MHSRVREADRVLTGEAFRLRWKFKQPEYLLRQETWEVLPGGVAEQVAVHAQVITKERLADAAVEQVRAKEVESLGFFPQGFGVHHAPAFFGFAKQSKEILGDDQVFARHVGADDQDVQLVPFPRCQVATPGRDLRVGGGQLRAGGLDDILKDERSHAAG